MGRGILTPPPPPDLKICPFPAFRVAAVFLGWAVFASGQEIPRPSIAKQKEIRPPPSAYNVRIGPVLLLADAGLGLEYNSNVGLTHLNAESDLVLFPTVGLQATWQISKLNTVQFRTGISYTKYLSHPQLDTQTLLLSPDSEIRLNVYIGDFRISVHDQFSIQQDPVTQGSVSGVASLGRIINTAGLSVLWDLNDVITSVGYDHLTLTTTGATTVSGQSINNVSNLDRTTDQVSATVSFRTGMSRTGLEGTLASTRYTTGTTPGYTSASVGPFITLPLTRYTSLAASVGYRNYATDSLRRNSATASTASTAGQTPDSSASSGSYYAYFGLQHRLNRYYSDRFYFSRTSEVGLYSDFTQTNSLGYGSAWTLGRQVALSTDLLFQDIDQISGLLGVAARSHYQLWSASLGTSYTLTKHLSLNAGYILTIKLADDATTDYSQSRFRLGFQYQF